MTVPESPYSSLSLLRKIWSHLSQRRRLQVALLLLVMLSSGLAELISLGAVLPFLAVLTNPEQLWQQSLIQSLALAFGVTQPQQLVLPATFAFAFTAVLAAAIRLLNLWLNGRLAAAVGSDLSCEAYERTLYQPYVVHLQRNTAEVINGITSQTGITVAALNSFLQLATASIVAVGLFAGLLVINAFIAIAAAVLFCSAYLSVSVLTRKELRVNSQRIANSSVLQLKALQEGLGAIRDVLLDASQHAYLEIYRQTDRPVRQYLAKNGFLGAFPRYAFEALGMVAIALLGGMLVSQSSGSEVIPLLGALALGAQRLLPALQQIYSGWAAFKSSNAAIHSVLGMLNQPLPPIVGDVAPFSLCQNIVLEDVSFCYNNSGSDVLSNLNLEICRGERVGLIGSTGSGKSTTLDLLMGLLKPTVGRLLVDGIDLHDPNSPEMLEAWRGAISHVPQTIYLADSSISENIAFGTPTNEIDIDRVRQACEYAQIAQFIESCPNGYDTFVGERGIRLSGGQRQRIGIARALYKQSSVIILDEATSALDNTTEKAVMEAVEGLGKDLTIIIIAHRLSTVAGCHRVIHLEKGVISAEGPPHQVLPSIS